MEPVHWDLLKSQERKSFQTIQQENGILFALGSHAAKFSKFYNQPNQQTSCWITQLSYLPKNLTTVKYLSAVTKLKINLKYFKKLQIELSRTTEKIEIIQLIHGFSKNKYPKPKNIIRIRYSFYTFVHRSIVNQDLQTLETMIQRTTV